MAGRLWVPGAERIEPSSPGGTSDFPEAGPRAVAHTTESPSGPANGDPNFWFHQMVKVLRGKAAEPQLVYDPATDHLGQFMPLNATGRALQNDGSRRTNRVGKVCIQIEFVAWASRPFTRTWKPGRNFIAMMDSIRSWGIPDLWPSGHPPAYPTGSDERSRDIWYNRAGWYGHSQVPANSHGDPGAIDIAAFFGAAQLQPETWAAWPSAKPAANQMGGNRGNNAPINLAIKAALIVNGHYDGMTGDVTQKWNKATADALKAFQKDRKITEDGIGPETWAALGKLHKDATDFPGHSVFEVGKSSVSSLVGQSLLVLQGFRRPLGDKMTRAWRPEAERALRRFQLSEPALAGDADGQWGPLTWKKAWTDNT